MSSSVSSGPNAEPRSPRRWWQYPPLRNALLAGMVAGAAWILAYLGIITRPVEIGLYLVAIPLGGYHWAREGIGKLIREREVGIEILMLAATAGAATLGLWDEAAALVVLYGAAEGLEEYTYKRTRTAIRALLDLVPREARVVRDGSEVMVPAETLEPGDLFVVRPGEAIPTDGVIVRGSSSLNESPVTGESIPVDKEPGMPVFAASINCEGALTVRVTARFTDNSLSRIIHLVEQAQEQKGRGQQWMERFGRRYSPAVLLASFLMLLIPWLVGADPGAWAHRAVILLVAAAPCALIMSMPIAMAAGIGGAGKHGILIKGGAHLEHLGIVTTVAFDKTGTLTEGSPTVSDVIALEDDETGLLRVAAAVEQYSEHPLARAIVERARESGTDVPEATNFRSLVGAGALADLGDVTWYVGKPRLFSDLGFEAGILSPRIEQFQAQGKTVVLVGTTEGITGLLALQDTLRDSTPAAIERLHALGLRTVMLTGDNFRAARHMARVAGIDDVRADLRPEDKVTAIEGLLQDGPVLMVGDGVNDAPALAAATCGVAMGAAGTDAAIEAADVALMADDLGKLAEALEIGRKARRVSVQNIIFGVAVLVVLIPAGVGGFISIAMTVLAHEASELLAVANGLRAGSSQAA